MLFVHSIQTSRFWPAGIELLYKVISKLFADEILIWVPILVSKQFGDFRMHEVIGQFIESWFMKISVFADAIIGELSKEIITGA